MRRLLPVVFGREVLTKGENSGEVYLAQLSGVVQKFAPFLSPESPEVRPAR